MSQTVTVFRIMIASPSDVAKERQATVEAISRWNSLNSFNKKVVILPLCWELDAPQGIAEDAQDIIDRKLVAISDMVIGIFRSKLGRKPSNFTSYTIREIRKHIDNGKQALLFFGTPSRAITVKSSQDQTKLLRFKTNLKKELGADAI